MPPGSIEPPAWLNDRAREHWGELAPVYKSAGLLTTGDRQALALLCKAFSRFRSNPADDKARDLYRRMLVEFGLTPSSRSRLKPTAEPARDRLAEFLSRRPGHSSATGDLKGHPQTIRPDPVRLVEQP